VPLSCTSIERHINLHGIGPVAMVVGAGGDGDDRDEEGEQYNYPDLYFDPFADAAGAADLVPPCDSDAEDNAQDPQDPGPPEFPTDDYVIKVSMMAQQLVEAMAHNQVRLQGVTTVLKILHGTVFTLCPVVLVSLIPGDARALKKTAQITPLPHHYRHFCPGPPQKKQKSLQLKKLSDHHLFATDPLDVHCPLCTADTRYFAGTQKPQRAALYYDLDGYLTRSLQLQELRDLQIGWRQDARMARTRGEYTWLMDGSIVKGGQGKIFEGCTDEEECFVFAGCRDATVISHMSKTSLLPVVFDNLALPERVRRAPEAKYLAALFPEGMKATNVTQRPIAEMFARRMPGNAFISNTLHTTLHSAQDANCVLNSYAGAGGEPLLVEFVEYTGEGGAAEEYKCHVRAVVSWFTDDLRGLAGPCGGFYAPARRGACLQCRVEAMKISAIDVTVWPGACKHIAGDSPQRDAFKTWYLKNPAISAAADGAPPQLMTKAFAHKSALKCMLACHPRASEGAWEKAQAIAWWRDMDVWSELLPYWDRVLQNINDPAHELFNIVKSLISMIGGLGQHKLSAKRRAFSRGLGQTTKGSKPPWTNGIPNQVRTCCYYNYCC
jgi:hypothetical protein